MGGVALLVIGNSPATLLPFIVGTLEDGFNLNKQTTGSVVSTELIAMSLSAIFFGLILTNLSFPNLLPYLLVSICLSLFCIFLTKNQLDK